MPATDSSPDLIPALPSDIAFDCLHRVTVKAHPKLRQVCRSWNSLASNPTFYETRRKLGYAGDYACFLQSGAEEELHDEQEEQKKKKMKKRKKAICYGVSILDVERGEWTRIRTMPEELRVQKKGLPQFSQCLAVGREVVIVGGWDAETWEVVRTVYRVDIATGRWRRGAEMPKERSFFGCARMGAEMKIVVAGGHDGEKNALRTADVYDVSNDRWEELPDMAEERDECKALTEEGGGVVVVSGFATHSQGRYSTTAERFQPATGRWEVIESAWIGGIWSPASMVATQQGELYGVVDGKLMRSSLSPASTAASPVSSASASPTSAAAPSPDTPWSPSSPLPHPLSLSPPSSCSFLSSSSSILLSSSSPSPSLWLFHLPSSSWSQLPCTPSAASILQSSSCTLYA